MYQENYDPGTKLQDFSDPLQKGLQNYLQRRLGFEFLCQEELQQLFFLYPLLRDDNDLQQIAGQEDGL